MGLAKLQSEENNVDSEAFFTRYYPCVLKFALMRTKSLLYAEELTQEAFFRLFIKNQDLTKIYNPEGYLQRVVWNIHLNQIREAERMKSFLSYDSMPLGLFSLELSDQENVRKQAHTDLIDICRYACIRKTSSRVGSIFILRFFYEYTPSEIAGLIKSSRADVYSGIQSARNEAVLYLKKPNQLKFISRNKVVIPEFNSDQVDTNIFARIIEFVALCCSGTCFSQKQLHALYNQSDKALTTTELSHIVSCANCLGNILIMLDLPPIPILDSFHYSKNQEKHSSIKKMKNDSDAKDDDDIGGPNAGGGDYENFQVACLRRKAQIKDHRPDELRIYIDDVLISNLPVEHERNVIDMQTPLSGCGEFIHVSSDHGMRMLMVDITNTELEIIEEKIDLNDNRTLKIQYNTKTRWLHLCYSVPLSVLDDNLATEIEIGSQKWLSEKIISWFHHVLPISLQAKLSSLLLGNRSNQTNEDFEEENLFNRYYKDPVSRSSKRFKFATVVFMVAAIAVASIIVFHSKSTSVTAAEILAKATSAEKQWIDNKVLGNRVQHRTINIVGKLLNNGETLSNQIVERWLGKTFEVKRVFENNSTELILIAEEKKISDGTSIIYRNGQSQLGENILISPGDIWRVGFSVQDFKSMIEDVESTELQILDNTYVLKKNISRVGSGMRIVYSSITLRKDDLYPIEQVLHVKVFGEEQLREYRFKETYIEYTDKHMVPQKIFDLDPKVLSSNELNNSSINEKGSIISNEASYSKNLSVGEQADLIVEILYNLDLKGGNVEEQSEVKLTSDGFIHINSVVANNQRKAELLSTLAFVASNPAVVLNIQSNEEATRSVKRSPVKRSYNVPLPEPHRDSNYLNRLEEYIVNKLKTKDIGEISRTKAGYIFEITQTAEDLYLEALGIRRIVGGLSTEHLHSLSPKARVKWVGMVNKHLREYSLLLNKLEGDLVPILSDVKISDNIQTTFPIDITNGQELNRRINKLQQLSFSLYSQTKKTFLLEENEDVSNTFVLALSESKTVVKTLRTSFKQ